MKVAAQVSAKKSNVISFKTTSLAAITQKDLIQERLLSIDVFNAKRALRAKRNQIRELVENGAKTEEGPHFAELSRRRRRDGREYTRLVVR